ncbi:hypothetical protein ACFL3Y_00655, partial [Pseudomonadota bacterium]
LDRRALVVEVPAGVPPVAAAQLPPRTQHISLLQDRSDRYELALRSSSPVWLYLADANYPGWNAYLDGIETTVYSAQLMGKAVFLPAGDHTLELVFEPLSFRVGLGLSILSGCALVLCLLLRPGRWKPEP